MGGGNKNKKTYPPDRNYSQTMMDMHAAQWVLCKGGLPDLVKFLVGHCLIGRVFYRLHFGPIDDVGPYLPQKNIMGTNCGPGLVPCYRIGNKLGPYRPFQKHVP